MNVNMTLRRQDEVIKAMLLGQGKRTHYVLYQDGDKSVPMDKKTAQAYADIFRGTIVRVNEKGYRAMIKKIAVIVGGGIVLALVRIFTDQPAFTGFNMYSLKNMIALLTIMSYGAVVYWAVNKDD